MFARNMNVTNVALCLTLTIALYQGISTKSVKHKPFWNDVTVNISHPACFVPTLNSTIVSHRIVAGESVKNRVYPFYAVVTNFGQPIAGASIISEYWILTAAHIVVSNVWLNSSSKIRIGVGSNNVRLMTFHEVDKWISHPSFEKDRRFDIALIKLKHPLRFTPSVKPICFPNEVFAHVDVPKVEVVGFGFETFRSKSGSKNMKWVELDVISNRECSKRYQEINHPIRSCHTCTWTNGKDACLGDSGGPMFVVKDSIFYQWGIVSHGVTCADRFPGVFTTVTYFLNWIQRVMIHG